MISRAGPSPVPNLSRAHWFVSFINDCTKSLEFFLLKNKSAVVLSNFHNMVKNQFGVIIKMLRSDNARDYFNQILILYFQHEGIINESSCVNTPQQNRVTKRKNGHLLNTTRALLFQNHVLKFYYVEGVLPTTHLINRLPSKVLSQRSPT